jgi:hypothetical protein
MVTIWPSVEGFGAVAMVKQCDSTGRWRLRPGGSQQRASDDALPSTRARAAPPRPASRWSS